MAFPETEEKFLAASQRIQHALFINEAMLIALLKRCGHEIDTDVDIHWTLEGARVKWTTPVI